MTREKVERMLGPTYTISLGHGSTSLYLTDGLGIAFDWHCRVACAWFIRRVESDKAVWFEPTWRFLEPDKGLFSP
jgi:hypothetical protein